MDEYKLFIVILNWKQYELTAQCLRSILNSEASLYEIVVIDNNSEDGSVDKLRSEFGEDIQLLVNNQNIGFAAGNNVGILHAIEQGADYVMLLNNDTTVSPGFLTSLVDTINTGEYIGAVTPKIYFMYNPSVIWAVGGAFEKWSGSAHCRGKGEIDCGQFDRVEAVSYATGCCILFSLKALETVGLLDEKYFAYFEDVDWCLRAQKAGFKILYEPSSVIWHVAGASSSDGVSKESSTSSPYTFYLSVRNNMWLVRGHLAGTVRLAAIGCTFIRCLLFRSMKQVARGRWRHLTSLWKGMYDGCFDFR